MPHPVVEAAERYRAQLLSQETALERAGYDAEKEMERRGMEQSQRATLGEELLRQFERGGQV